MSRLQANREDQEEDQEGSEEKRQHPCPRQISTQKRSGREQPKLLFKFHQLRIPQSEKFTGHRRRKRSARMFAKRGRSCGRRKLVSNEQQEVCLTGGPRRRYFAQINMLTYIEISQQSSVAVKTARKKGKLLLVWLFHSLKAPVGLFTKALYRAPEQPRREEGKQEEKEAEQNIRQQTREGQGYEEETRGHQLS